MTSRNMAPSQMFTAFSVTARVLLIGGCLVIPSMGLQGSVLRGRGAWEGFSTTIVVAIIASSHVGFVVGSLRVPG